MTTSFSISQLYQAIDEGRLDIVKEAHIKHHGEFIQHYAFYRAAEAKQINILVWMIENYDDLPFDSHDDVTVIAAEKGYINIIEWALSTGWDMDSFTFSTAAYNGHLDILVLMRQNGFVDTTFKATYDVTSEEMRHYDFPHIVEWFKSLGY
jgi:hypothetical protein